MMTLTIEQINTVLENDFEFEEFEVDDNEIERIVAEKFAAVCASQNDLTSGNANTTPKCCGVPCAFIQGSGCS